MWTLLNDIMAVFALGRCCIRRPKGDTGPVRPGVTDCCCSLPDSCWRRVGRRWRSARMGHCLRGSPARTVTGEDWLRTAAFTGATAKADICSPEGNVIHVSGEPAGQ